MHGGSPRRDVSATGGDRPRIGVADDPRVVAAIARLTELERSLGEVGAEAAAAHQLLQHIHLI